MADVALETQSLDDRPSTAAKGAETKAVDPDDRSREAPRQAEPTLPSQAAANGGEESVADEAAEDPRSHPLARDLLFNPSTWRIWPAVAILRWMLRRARRVGDLMFRSKPSIAFAGAEIQDVALHEGHIDLVLSAPGLAAPGSSLPLADIARVVADMQPPGRGALAAWLDGPGNRFMQAVEAAQARNNAAFALATGGRIEAIKLFAELAGRSAPLSAREGGQLLSFLAEEPNGAVGLGALFIGPASASGLAALVAAFTSLPVEVQEFTGDETLVLRPARLGQPIERVLGRSCHLASAGVTIIIEGGSDEGSHVWATNSARRLSLSMLCRAYIGDATPTARLFLDLNANNVPLATLGTSALGIASVLGSPKGRVRLPVSGDGI